MALISPGVEVTVIDESQYLPAAAGTVPFILFASAQNKISGTGTGIAAGTLEVNAGKVYLITSQRDMATTFGNPFWYTHQRLRTQRIWLVGSLLSVRRQQPRIYDACQYRFGSTDC